MKKTLLLILLASCLVSQPVHASNGIVIGQQIASVLNADFSTSVLAVQEAITTEETIATSNKAEPDKQTGTTTSTPKLTPEQREDRKQMLPVILLLLIGVAILGGIIFLVVILLGSRARRIVRKPLPTASLRNPLWYLKPNAANASDSENSPESFDEPPESDHE